METRNIVTAFVSLPVERYATASARLGFAEEWERRLANAGFDDSRRSRFASSGSALRSKPLAAQSIDGRPQSRTSRGNRGVARSDTGLLLRTLGIAIRKGRAFTRAGSRCRTRSHDCERSVRPADCFVARTQWDISSVRAQVVGVAADVRNSGGTERDNPEYYVPRNHASAAQIYSAPDELRRVVAIVRTPLSTDAAARELREMVASLDASLPAAIETVGQSTARLSARPRFNAILLALFAAVGLILSGGRSLRRPRIRGLDANPRNRDSDGAGSDAATGGRDGDGRRGSLASGRSIVRLVALGRHSRVRSAGLLYNVTRYDPAAWSMATAVLIAVALAAAWSLTPGRSRRSDAGLRDSFMCGRESWRQPGFD